MWALRDERAQEQLRTYPFWQRMFWCTLPASGPLLFFLIINMWREEVLDTSPEAIGFMLGSGFAGAITAWRVDHTE